MSLNDVYTQLQSEQDERRLQYKEITRTYLLKQPRIMQALIKRGQLSPT